MNAEPLITEHKKEEGTAKYAKYAKNPDPSPKSGFGFACFAYFAVQEIARARILVASWRLGDFASKCLLIRVYPRPSVVHSQPPPIYSRRDAENAERMLNFNPLPFSAFTPLRAKIFAPFARSNSNRSASLLFAKTLPRIARIARMGKRRKDLESRTCLSVKSVVHSLSAAFSAPNLDHNMWCTAPRNTTKSRLIKVNQG
jgi:hypothetical protein